MIPIIPGHPFTTLSGKRYEVGRGILKPNDYVTREIFPCEFGEDHVHKVEYTELSVLYDSLCRNEYHNYPVEKHFNSGAQPLMRLIEDVAGGDEWMLMKLETTITKELRKVRANT